MTDHSSSARRSLARGLMSLLLVFSGMVPAYATGFVVLRGGGTPTAWYYDTGLQRWSALPDLPVPVGAGGAITTAFGSEVFVLRGAGTSEFYRLRTFPSPVWLRMPDLPEPVSAGSALGSSPWLGLFAVAGGGSTTLWRFDVGSATWSNGGSLPAAAGLGSALSYSLAGGVEALLGGSAQSFTSDWQSATWQTGVGFPHAAGLGAAIATMYDGCVYSLPGGQNGAAFYASGASWLQACTTGNRAAFPVGPSEGTSLIGSWDSNAFVYGLAGVGSRAIYRYDAVDNAWTQVVETPATIRPGGGATLYRGGSNLGLPLTEPLPLPAFIGTPTITIEPPNSPQSSQVIQGTGLPASMQLCVVMGGVNVGCGATTATGSFGYNFGTTNVVEAYPRNIEVVLDNGAIVHSGVQPDATYPQTVALNPSGSLTLSAPVQSFSAVIRGDGFPRGCESTVMYSVKSGVVSGLGAFPTWQGSWGYNFNYPAVADTADQYRWVAGFGLCNGSLFSGANPGGAYPRTVALRDDGHAGVISISPSSLTFPPTPISVLSPAQTLSVRNTGSGPLVIRDTAYYGGNQLDFLTTFPPPGVPGTPNPCFTGRVIEPGGNCNMGVRFRPTANGLRTSAIGFAHTDGDGFTLIPLRGGELPDTTPPVISCSATPSLVWPPNNKMIPVEIAVAASDDGSGLAGYSLVDVSSNEGASGDITGFTVGMTSTSGAVRAKRNGGGSGRTYSFTYRATDRAGNSASCTATVMVPHDQGK